ncbi:DNA-entry nuclease, partial [Streptococcus ruminantium]|nr:DNA-entry nuclease [Streptococcus ruminantium]
MKKNKFLLVSIIFTAILLVQPQNFQFLKRTFTQNDLASQLNISDSPEEK